jgi:hypothetical protein
VAAGEDVVEHRHVGKSAMFWKVRAIPSSAVRWASAHQRLALPPDLALLGPVDLVEAVEDRGLAGSVGTDDGEQFPSSTWNDTPSMARTPLKLSLMSWTSSRWVIGLLLLVEAELEQNARSAKGLVVTTATACVACSA